MQGTRKAATLSGYVLRVIAKPGRDRHPQFFPCGRVVLEDMWSFLSGKRNNDVDH